MAIPLAHTHKTMPLGRLLSNAWRSSVVIACRTLRITPPYLPVLLLFLTQRCNLRCKMCGIHQPDLPDAVQRELSTEQWLAVLDDAADKLGTTIVSISGGEPFLRRDLFEIIQHAAQKGLAVHLCTNATLLNQERVEKLRDAGVAAVSLSLESPDAPCHDALRGKGVHLAVLNAIQLLRQHAPQIHIGINYLITRRNFRAMTNMLAFAEQIGVHQIKFAPIHTNLLHRHKDQTDFDDLLFEENDLPLLESELLQLRQACQNSPLLTSSPEFFRGIADLYRKPRRFRCYAGYAVCAVAANGAVAPCCDMDSSRNVKDAPLSQIWRSPEFHRLRQQVHTCASPCWDTTNTELSLRMRPWTIIANPARMWRELRFYFKQPRT